jgi:hypothetical protein
MQQQQHFPSPFPRSCISLSLPQQAAPHRIDSHDCLVCNVQTIVPHFDNHAKNNDARKGTLDTCSALINAF